MIEQVAREEWPRAVATIARATGDLGLAEDAVQDAFATALERWPRDGVPRSPGAWITTVARNRALDVLRRKRVHARVLQQVAALESIAHEDEHDEDGMAIPDERLALIFTCCHPALAAEAQVALTLRLVAGLSTDEIARAFLVPPTTMAQRLVRAQRKVRDAGIPIRTPARDELDERVREVLAVLYLVFNQGYSAPDPELSVEAIRLGELLGELMPAQAEVHGLRALMYLHHSRRDARFGADGLPVLLAAQDRARWDSVAIDRGLEALAQAAALGVTGQYQLQAAIAACHVRAPSSDATDWRSIVALYGMLHRMVPSPVVALNRAAALSLAEGPQAALPLVDALADELDGYHLFHSTRADLLRRLDRLSEARSAYRRALEIAPTDADREFLAGRIAQLD